MGSHPLYYNRLSGACLSKMIAHRAMQGKNGADRSRQWFEKWFLLYYLSNLLQWYYLINLSLDMKIEIYIQSMLNEVV